MGKPSGQDEQKAWTGGDTGRRIRKGAGRTPRAELLTRGEDGTYRVTGKGGTPGKAAPKQPAKKTPAKRKAAKAKSGTAPAAPSPAAHVQAMAETVTSSFMDRITRAARRKGGVLTIQDLEVLNKEFSRKAEDLKVIFEKSLEQFARAYAGGGPEHRGDAFERLIVHKLERLFADGKGLAKKPHAVSRRMLPGFFMALNVMLGADAVERHRATCRKITSRAKKGGTVDWDRVYADAKAAKVVEEAVVGMAGHLKDLNKRTQWFVNLVNGNLAPPSPGADPKEAGWTLTDKAFLRCLRALTADLEKALADESGRLKITKAYGADAVVDLAELMKKLGKSR